MERGLTDLPLLADLHGSINQAGSTRKVEDFRKSYARDLRSLVAVAPSATQLRVLRHDAGSNSVSQVAHKRGIPQINDREKGQRRMDTKTQH